MINKSIQVMPLIITAFGVALLCYLGVWQLQRLSWKENILAQIDAQYQQRSNEDLLIDPSVLEQDFKYKRALLVGQWDYKNQIPLGPRTHNGKIGYHIITPFEVIDGGILLVNRGWVSQDWPLEMDSAQIPLPAFITGLIQRPPKPNMFTANNSPEKNQWVHLDIEDIKAAHSLEEPVYQYVMLLESELPEGNINDWPPPIVKATKPHLNNNHMQYAIFWFVMAGALIVIYVLRFHYKK